MTFDEFTDVLSAGIGNALLGIMIALFQIVPPMVITIFLVWFFARQMRVREAGVNILLHGSTFGFIGLIIAYLYSDRGDSIVSGLLPHFIAGVALAFQLAGRMKEGWRVPIESQATVAAAAATAFCFLFGSIYFESIRPKSSAGQTTAPPLAVEAASPEPDLGESGIEEILKPEN